MKKFISLIIAGLLVISSCFIAFAQNTNNDVTISKMDETLKEKLEQSGEDDIISVWVWFNDVDEEVFENAKADAGASSGFDEAAYSYSLTEKEREVFEKAQSTDDTVWEDSLRKTMESYSQRTSADREEYNKKYRDYQSAFRNELSEIFTERNTKLKNELGIDDSKVDFLSALTPSAILSLSKSKILEIINNNLPQNEDVLKKEFEKIYCKLVQLYSNNELKNKDKKINNNLNKIKLICFTI